MGFRSRVCQNVGCSLCCLTPATGSEVYLSSYMVQMIAPTAPSTRATRELLWRPFWRTRPWGPATSGCCTATTTPNSLWMVCSVWCRILTQTCPGSSQMSACTENDSYPVLLPSRCLLLEQRALCLWQQQTRLTPQLALALGAW